MKKTRIEGIVDWYYVGKGYGFIEGEDGERYFAYHSEIQMEGFRKLGKHGQKVTFVPDKDEQGRNVAKEIVIEAE